jgi:hypothetical protein
MSRSRPSVGVVAAVLAVLCAASIAHAGWNATATGGPLSVTAGVLATPTNVGGAVGTCIIKTSVDVIVTWDATTSPFADGYQVLRATRKAGPYSLLATVPGAGTTTYDDTSTGFGSNYFYELVSTRDAWTSVASAPVKVSTPSRRTCT